MDDKSLAEIKKLYEFFRGLERQADQVLEQSPVNRRLAALEAENAYFSRYEYRGTVTPDGSGTHSP